MSVRSHREGGCSEPSGLPDAPGVPPGARVGTGATDTPPHGWQGSTLCVACWALHREPGGLGHLGVPPGAGGAPAGCCPMPPATLGRARTSSAPFQGQFADLASAAAEGLPLPSATPAPGIWGLPPSQGLSGAQHRACGVSSWAPARQAPAGSLSPPSLPSLSPPGTLKVLKVKYYRLLCCCLTTTDKLRTSCQNVSAQQINIQNESQRYVVYN